MSHIPASPDERLARLERQLAQHRTHLSRRSRVTAFIALVLLAVMGGYFYFGYTNFDEVTRPEMVVQVAQTFVDTNLPDLRKSLQAEIIRSAPGWADQLSQELQANMPQARQKLEDYVVTQMDVLLDQTQALSQEQFRNFLKENRPALERGFQDLAANPTIAEQTMTEVINGLDQQFSQQMKLEASDLFDTVTMMKKKLDLLAKAQNLTNEQLLERRVLMITRRMQLETVEPGPATREMLGAAPVSATPVVGETASEAAAPAPETPTPAEPPKSEGEDKEETQTGEKEAKATQ